MKGKQDVWPLSEGNIVADLERWKKVYVGVLQASRYAGRTVVIYSGVVDELIEYSRQYQDEVTMGDIGTFFITRFLDDKDKKSKKGISDATRMHYIKVLKAFFKFIDENNIEGYGILYNLRNLKLLKQNGVKKKKPAYSEEQVERIMLAIENIRSMKEKHKIQAFTSTRNFLLTKFVLFSGIRANEMAKVRYEDLEPYIDPKSGTPLYRVEIEGKGGDFGYVYIRQEKIDDELEIMKNRFSAEGLIAVSSNGKPLGPVQINHNVSRITKAAGMSKRGVHIFRHTYARQLLRDGEDIEIVKQLLRHKRITTTVDFYIDTDEDAKAAAVARMGTGRKRREA